MTVTNVTTCNADHHRRWFGSGHDGAWPDHEIDGRQRPVPHDQLCAISGKIGRHSAIYRLGHLSRQACGLLVSPGAPLKSP